MTAAVTTKEWLEARRAEVDRALEELLPGEAGPAGTLARAMRYAIFGGGKRLRPLLALAACDAFGGDLEAAVAPASALEMIHTYSLVHDDLPAMDDDDLRRGRPTTHKAFGEAEAILAGDALLTLAFEVLATKPRGDGLAARRADAVAIVARASGHAGMVGGQIADLEAEGSATARDRLDWIHRHKTGALFSAAAELGALHGGATEDERRGMARFGHALGLAFQVQDDVLDRTSDAASLGKTPGKDERSGKATYPALLGLEASRAEARRLAEAAAAEIPASARVRERLLDVTRSVVDRSR
ncbi:MAG TPA: farnesyl diphosphate synthase [Candidatus Polarisedimenticolaceae bacterium]|nr:farnesyl diphosphate synthase [Candidatus Polarisedimenticolaceae bacterium]